MYNIDPATMIEWIESNIKIEERSVAYYHQFPELGCNGRLRAIHQQSLEYLQGRLIMWESIK